MTQHAAAARIASQPVHAAQSAQHISAHSAQHVPARTVQHVPAHAAQHAPTHTAQHIPAPSLPQRSPYDILPSRELEASILAALDKVNSHMSSRMDMMEIATGSLSKVTSEALQVANTARQENKEAVERLQNLLLKTAEMSLGKANRLEGMIGDPEQKNAGAERPTLFGRIEQLERAILELAESVGDPDAARSVVVRHEAGVNTSLELRFTADVGVDAMDPVPSIPRTEMGIQVEQPITAEAEVEARQPSPEMNTVGVQTTLTSSPHTGEWIIWISVHFYKTDIVAAPVIQSRYRAPSFTAQPLVAASWSPQEAASGEQIPSPTMHTTNVKATASPIHADSSSSRSSSPIPSPPPCPLAMSANTSTATRTIASTSHTTLSPQPSSIFDEQEILDTLDPMSQCFTSPYEPTPQSPPPSSPIRAPLHLPHSYGISPKFPPCTPPVRPIGRFPTHSSLRDQTQGQFASKFSSPPRPTGILAASGTTPRSQPPSLQKGFTQFNAFSPSFAPASSFASSSSLSSLSHLGPSLSPPPPPQASSPRSPPHESSPSLSPPPPSPLPEPQVQVPVKSLQQIIPALSPAPSLSSMSSLSSIASASAPGKPVPQKPRQGLRPTAARDGKIASATVRAKQERDDSASLARPKKRRRTLATTTELQHQSEADLSSFASASASKSTRGGRGKGRGRGRGRGKGRGMGRKAQLLVITPLKTEVEVQPLPNEPRKRYEPPQIGVHCPWPSKVLGEETSRREVRDLFGRHSTAEIDVHLAFCSAVHSMRQVSLLTEERIAA